MKRIKNYSKKRTLQLAITVILSIVFFWGCNGPEEEVPAPLPVHRGPATFLHLKIDSAVLVDKFYKGDAQFNKIVFDFIVTDFRVFPDSLRMGAYGTRGGGNDLIFCDPVILDTVKSETTVRTEQLTDSVMFATQEITRQNLRGIVGNDGEGYDPPGPVAKEAYDYLLFIPTVLDTCNKKYLRYKVRAIKRGVGGGASGDGITNPCPPNKPE